MPRQPQFDRQKVLDRALALFWSDGYEASSVSRLLAVMDLNRGSLYGSFGGKSALYSEVLDHYMAMLCKNLFSCSLLTTEDPKKAITSFYQKAFVEQEDKDKLANGCLFFNAISELNKTEPELAGKAIKAIAWIRQLFLSRLVEAQQAGQISPEKDPEALSDYLIGLTAGLRALCKSGADVDVLQKVIDTGLSPVFD